MEFEQASEMLVPVPGTPAPPKRSSRAMAVTGVVALLAVGGGAFALSRVLQTGTADPLAAIPAGADLVVTLDLEALASDRTQAFVNTLSRAFDEDSKNDGIDEMIGELDDAVSKELGGMTFSKDLAPLLGKQAVMAVLDIEVFDSEQPPVLVAIATRDAAAVDAFLARLEDHLITDEDPATVSREEYAGTELRIFTRPDPTDDTLVMAHLGDLVVIGNSRDSLTAAIDAYGDQPSMADDPELLVAFEAIPTSWIRMFLGQLPTDTASMFGGLYPTLADQQQEYGEGFKYAAFGVGITEAGLQMDGVTSFDEAKLPAGASQSWADPAFIAGLPTDTIGYLLLPSFWNDPTVQDGLLLGLMGIDLEGISAELGFHPVDDFLAYLTSGIGISTTGITTDASGFGVLGSGVVSNPGAVAETLDQLASYLETQAGMPVRTLTVGGQEFLGIVDDLGEPMLVFGLSGDRLLISSGSSPLEGFLGSDAKLSADAAYQAAKTATGDELEFFVDTQAMLLELAGVMDIDEQELARLAPLGPMGMSSSSLAGEQSFRLVWLVDY